MTTESSSRGKCELIETYLNYANRLAAQFYRERGRPPVDRDDLCASAILGLCEAADRFDASRHSAFQTYAFLRIRGAMYDFLRYSGQMSRYEYRRRREVCVARQDEHVRSSSEASELVAEETPERTSLRHETSKRLFRQVERLPSLERDVIRLHYYGDRSFEEIRRQLGRGSKSWYSRLHSRALERLRLGLEDEAVAA